MNLLQRILYYGAGFAAGMVILFFFLSGKRTSCDYSPNARVLKNIRLKERQFTPNMQRQLKTNAIDTATISQLLFDGDVDFSRSNTKLDSCKVYAIQGKVRGSQKVVYVKNCNRVATVLRIENNE